MLKICVSHLKPLLRRWPLLLLLLACQVLFAYMSAGVLSERRPALRLAVWSEEQSPAAGQFLESLERIPELSVTETKGLAEGKDLLEKRRVLGLVVIEAGLEDRIASNDGAFVSFIPAPGTNAGRVAGKYAAAAAVALQAEQRLRNALAALGAEAPSLRAEAEEVLSVAYDGPPLLQDAFASVPGYGTPAIFVLSIAVYAALTLAGPDRRRVVMRGRAALAMDYFGGFFAVSFVCALLLAAYFLSVFLLYGLPADRNAMCAFAALGLYCVALGGLIAALGLRKAAVWLFLPWLLANISLGGALWGVAFSNPVVAPLLPVRHALYGCAGDAEHVCRLLSLAFLAMAFSLCLLCFRPAARGAHALPFRRRDPHQKI
jgi:hypothetical protein